MDLTLADADPCPLGCGHEWHGLTCERAWKRDMHGRPLSTGEPCGCPGPWQIAKDIET